MNEIAQGVYDILKQSGEIGDLPETFDEFYSQVSSNEQLGRAVYDILGNYVGDLPDTFEGFYSQAFGGQAQPQAQDAQAQMQPEQKGWDDVARINTMGDQETPDMAIDLSSDINTRNKEGLITMPFNTRFGGVELEDWQIESRLNNDRLSAGMFAKGVDPYSMVAQGAVQEDVPDKYADMDFKSMARNALRGEEEGDINEVFNVNADGEVVGAKFLSYEGNQMLNHALKKEREFRRSYKEKYADEDPIAIAAGMGVTTESTLDNLPAPVREMVRPAEELLKPELIGSGSEQSFDAKLYDLDENKIVYAKQSDVNAYLEAILAEDGQTIETATPEEMSNATRKFADRYTSADVMNKVMADAGLSDEATRFETAWSGFAGGALGIPQESAADIIRLTEGYINAIEGIGAAFGLKPPTPRDPLSMQRRREEEDWILGQVKEKQRGKLLSAIGAYRSNPEYQEEFLSGVLPSAAGSAAGFAIMSGGKIGNVAALGALTNAEAMYEEARVSGAGYDDVFAAAILGAGIGATEAVPFDRFFKGLSGEAKSSFLGSLLKQGAEEGFQEGFTAAMNNLTAQQLYDASREIINSDVLTEAAAGAVIGVGMGVGPAIANKIRDVKDKKTKRLLEDAKKSIDTLVEQAKAKKEQEDKAGVPEPTPVPTPPPAAPSEPAQEVVSETQEAPVQPEVPATEEVVSGEIAQPESPVEPIDPGYDERSGEYKSGRLKTSVNVVFEDGAPTIVNYETPYKSGTAEVEVTEEGIILTDEAGDVIPGNNSIYKATRDVLEKNGVLEATPPAAPPATPPAAPEVPPATPETENTPAVETPAAAEEEVITEEEANQQKIDNLPPLPDVVSSDELDRAEDDIEKDYFWVVDTDEGYSVVEDDPREKLTGRRFDNYFDAMGAKIRLDRESEEMGQQQDIAEPDDVAIQVSSDDEVVDAEVATEEQPAVEQPAQEEVADEKRQFYWVTGNPRDGFEVVSKMPKGKNVQEPFDNYQDALNAKFSMEIEVEDNGFTHEGRIYMEDNGRLRRVKKDGTFGNPLADSNPAQKAFMASKATEPGPTKSQYEEESPSDVIDRTLSMSGVDVDRGKGSITLSVGNDVMSSQEKSDALVEQLEDLMDGLSRGEMSTEDSLMYTQLEKLRDQIKNAKAQASQDTEVDVEEEVEPELFEKQIADMQRLGMKKADAMAIRDAVVSGKATDESRSAFKSREFKKALAKKNSLADSYIHEVYNSKAEKDFRKENGSAGKKDARREAYIPIQNALNSAENKSWFRGNVSGANKKGKDTRRRAKGIRDSLIAALRNGIVKQRDAQNYVAGAIMADDVLAPLWNRVKEMVPEVSPSDLAALGFSSQEKLKEAVASQVILNDAVSNAKGEVKITADNSKVDENAAPYMSRGSSYFVTHMADQIADSFGLDVSAQSRAIDDVVESELEVTDDFMLDSESESVFGDEGWSQRTDAPAFTPGVDASASQSYLSAVFEKLADLIPGLKINFTDYALFEQAVQKIHGPDADPSKFAGIVVGDELHINPNNARLDTPFHELAHVWLVALSETAKPTFKLMEGLVKGTAAYIEARKAFVKAGEIEVERLATIEALAQLIGERGAIIWGEGKKTRLSRDIREAMEWHSQRQQRISDVKKPGVWYRAKPRLIAIADLIDKFYNSIRRYLGIRVNVNLDKASLRDLIDMSAVEIVSGETAVDLNGLIGGHAKLIAPTPKEKRFQFGVKRKQKLNKANITNEAFAIVNDRLASMSGSFESPRNRRWLKDWTISVSLHLWNSFNRLGMYEMAMEEWGLHLHKDANGMPISEELELVLGKSKHIINKIAADLFGMTRTKRTEAKTRALNDSVLGRMKADGIKLSDLDAYMMAKFAEERNQQVVEKRADDIAAMTEYISSLEAKGSKRTSAEEEKLVQLREDLYNLTSKGSGMTVDEAQKIMDDVDGRGQTKLYDQYANEIYETTLGRTFPMLVESGLLSQEQLESILEISENYVPLQVMEFAENWGTSFAFNIEKAEGEGSIFKKLRGTGKYARRLRSSPTRVMMEQAAHIIMLAERNKILLKMKDVIEGAPNDRWGVRSAQFMPIKKDAPITDEVSETEEPVDPEDLIVRMMRIDNVKENEVPFKDNGVQKFLVLNDPDLVKAFMPSGPGRNANTNDAFKFLYRALGLFQNIRRNLNTVFNVSFPPVAYLADLGMSLALIDQIPGKGLKRQLFKEHRGAMKALRQKAWTGSVQDPEWAKVYEEMAAAGGLISFRDISGISSGITDYQREFENDMVHANNSGRNNWGRVMWEHTGGAIYTALEMQAEVFEMTMRLAAYKVARSRGMSENQSAHLAKNITVNFEKKGHTSNFMNALFLFANAKFQGSMNYMMLSLKHKKIMRNNVAAMVMGFTLSAMNDVILGDDDEEYKKVSEEEHRMQMYIAVPGAGDDYLLKYRTPYGMNVWTHGGKLLYDLMAGKKDEWDVATEMLTTIEEGLDPFPGSGFRAIRMAPDITKPIFEVAMNKTEFGDRPIMPEQKYGPEDPDSRRYFSTVTLPSKAFTSMLSELTGGKYTADGKDYMGGSIEVSPEVIDHFIFAYGGGALKEAMNLGSILSGDFDLNKVPVLRRFGEVATSKGWRDSKIFYNEVSKTYTRTRPMTDYQLDLFKSSYRAMTGQIDDSEFPTKSKKRKKSNLKSNYDKVINLNEERKKGQ